MRETIRNRFLAAACAIVATLACGSALAQPRTLVQDRYGFGCEATETIDANNVHTAVVRFWWDNSTQRDPETGRLLWHDQLEVQANMIRRDSPRVRSLPTDRNEYTLRVTAFGQNVRLIVPYGTFRVRRSTGGEMTYVVYPEQTPPPGRPGCYATAWNPNARMQ